MKVSLITAWLECPKPLSMMWRKANGSASEAPEETPRNSSQPTASVRCGLRNGHSPRSAPMRREGRGVAVAVMGSRKESASTP